MRHLKKGGEDNHVPVAAFMPKLCFNVRDDAGWPVKSQRGGRLGLLKCR